MKTFFQLVAFIIALIMAGQDISAFQFIFRTLDLPENEIVTGDVLNSRFENNANIQGFDVVNIGFGTSDKDKTGLKFSYDNAYGDASVRIKLNTGDRIIEKIKLAQDSQGGYFTINGNKTDADNSFYPNAPLSVIDITFHRNSDAQIFWAYLVNVSIYDKPDTSRELMPAELTYFDFIHFESSRAYVNPGQKVTAISQGADNIKIIYADQEIVSSTSGIVDFYPGSDGIYTIVASNSNGDTLRNDYEINVSDRKPAQGSIVTPANVVNDGEYYIISGNSNYIGYMMPDLKHAYCNEFTDKSIIVKSNVLVVKAVMDGDKWLLLTSEEGKGLCEVDGKLSIGTPTPADIVKEEDGFVIRFNGLGLYSQTTTFRLDINPPMAKKTRLYTLSRSVGDDCVAKTSFDTWQNGEAMYAVGNVEVQLPSDTPLGKYYLYCGGRRLAEFVDGVAEANLPATGGAALTVVCEDNGYVKGVTTLKTNAWEEVANVSFVKNISSNYRLHYDEQNRSVNVYIPLTLDAEIEYSHTAEVKCVEYPQASIITEGGHPVVFIPNYLTNVNMADVQGMTLDPIDVEVTPLIFVAEPQTIARSTDYSTGFVRGQTTTHHYEFSAGNVSAVDSIINDTFVATYYTIEGRRLTGEPTIPGIYIKRSGSDVSKIRIQ